VEQFKQRYSFSVMNYITASLASIIAVGLITIFISFWVTELADKDAQAINLSGSMRMQTYHIALAIKQDETAEAEHYVKVLDDTWNHSLFAQQRKENTSKLLNQHFDRASEHWKITLRPLLIAQIDQIAQQNTADSSLQFPVEAIETQVAMTDKLVNQFQKDAENKIKNLRAFQLFSLFITIGVGSVIFYLIKNRVEKPLSQLTDAADRIGKGEFGHQVEVEGRDEFALLSALINQMSLSISVMYDEMDERVQQRTLELHRNNITLEFLFNTARKILDSNHQALDYQTMLDELSASINGDLKLELCLFTAVGDRPYLHISPTGVDTTDCSKRSCDNCKGAAAFSSLSRISLNEKFPIVRDETHYGVINVRSLSLEPLEIWQEQLLRSVADQFALALSLSVQKDQEYRLAMLSERTVIARELHDSLAQALSYLKIQVTRLQKSNDKQRYDLQQPIIDELREGLSSAYRQLRELLTTFRLKIDTGGLKKALENTVEQLQERTDMQVCLHYQVNDLPLSPTEEIHLLQIVREASQNAINHSRGKNVDISLTMLDDRSIELTIDDDGIGIPDTPEKLNHYGLAIMNERSRQLGGEVKILTREQGGTRVRFDFQPMFLTQETPA